MVGLKRGTVKLEPYDPFWKVRFEQEKQLLASVFPESCGIHHVGSTAVAGLMAKPIIDIHLLFDPFSADIATQERMLEKLQGHDYHYRENGSTPSKLFFARGPEESRQIHLHVYQRDDDDHFRSLAFRNYLRVSDVARAQYQQLKLKLSQEFSTNRAAYTKDKSEFIQSVSEYAYSEHYHLSA